MLIKEYRIPLPLTVDEYKIAQLYMIAKKSRQESKGADSGSGVEILVNEPYEDGPGGRGQYTHKVYHIGSHLPGWFKSLLPKSALTVEEKAWNAYPYTKTQFSCPFVEKFNLEIETYYTPDGGSLENVFNLSSSELRNRVVDHIDVVKDQDQNYVAEEDPTIFVSEKTNRGPLDQDWVQTYSAECVGKEMPTPDGKAIMCAYKLCKVEFRYWGMQSKLERFIHDMALRNTMLRAHRQAWVWQDEWFGLTMDDIRNIERETAEMLARTMHGEELSEDEDDVVEAIPDPAGGNHKGSVSASFTSIEKPTIPTENELESPNVFSEEDSRLLENGSTSKKISRSVLSSDRISRYSLDTNQSNPIESIMRGSLGGESDDEFYDCPETAEEIRSLQRWNSLELVPDTDGETCESIPLQPAYVHSELRRAVSYNTEQPRPSRRHPTIELGLLERIRDASVEPSCNTTILILVVHGGSVLDASTDVAVRKSDVTTLRGAFESIMRQHYPGMVGHIVIKCVPCPNICSEALAILNHLSPYSFNASSGYENDRVPIGAITLFATASPRYQDFVNQTIVSANRVYQDFLGSEEGAGFTGPVCMIGDSMGAILAYDALCRNIRRPGSENSLYEDRESVSSPPSPRLQAPPDYMRAHSDIPSSAHHNHNRLSTSSHSPRISESTNDVLFHFEVADFFIFGSPIGTLLAYRKVQQTRDNPGSQYIIPRPYCTQVYNLFHPANNPVVARLEPILSAHFTQIQPVNIPRYQKYPMGDGQSLSILELLQGSPSVFIESSRHSTTSASSGRIRRQSDDSIVSGLFDTQQMQAMTIMKAKWWGAKRVDYALYCPEGLSNFPVNSLPHLFHSSYWESHDAISFILRQILNQDLLPASSDPDSDLKSFVPNQAREKWIKKRTSVKIRNGAANHRGNDVVSLDGRDPVLQGRFSYGPFDVAALSSEKVDIHIMKEAGGDWTHLSTELTDKNGRVVYTLKDRLGFGVYPIKMVVRGDHTVLDLYLTVVPPKTEAVVFSIDGSFTASVSVSGKDPKVRAGAVDIVRHWQDLGYLIIYVTGRPCMQLRKVVCWLSMHNFPLGLVSFADGLSTDPLRHKMEFLKGLQSEHQMIIHAAYGSSKDVAVYTSLGLSAQNINIIGKISKKQQGLCNNITAGYVEHLGELTKHGGSRPAQGNARMVIPKTCFGLPGKFPVGRRQTAFRVGSKKYQSLPASAPPIP